MRRALPLTLAGLLTLFLPAASAPAEEQGAPAAPAGAAAQTGPRIGTVFEGVPAVWGDADPKKKPPYELAGASADCSSGVTLRLKYKRVARLEPLLLDLSSLAVYVHFFRGVRELEDLPAFQGGRSSWPTETREWQGATGGPLGAAQPGAAEPRRRR